jgi:hypothetical protein
MSSSLNVTDYNRSKMGDKDSSDQKITQSNQKSYSYRASYGPISLNCHSDYESDLKNLDKIFQHLNQPNLNQEKTITGSFKQKCHQLAVRLGRLKNYLFGNGHWYNEECARKIVKYYAKNLSASDQNDAQRDKILKIYDRLATIKKGEKSYVNGIERSLIDRSLLKESHSWSIGDVFNSVISHPAVKAAGSAIANAAIQEIEDYAVQKAGKFVNNPESNQSSLWVELAVIGMTAFTAALRQQQADQQKK